MLHPRLFTMKTADHQLKESQLEAFLHAEGVHLRLVEYLEQLPKIVDAPVRSILDCGGGNGLFLDMLLDIFPEAQGTLIDAAPFMLERNTPHPRKRLIHGNLETFSVQFDADQKFDLIFFSDILHHCIVSTYRESREMQMSIVQSAVRLLAPNGRIVVCERILDSRWNNDFSARLVYRLTRCKTLAALVRLFGANTAGVGVCFFSSEQFETLCRRSGLEIADGLWIDEKDRQRLSRALHLLVLTARSMKYTLFLLKPTVRSTP